MKALVLTADGFEDLELFCPVYQFRQQGWEVTVAAPEHKTLTGKHGYTIEPDVPFSGIDPSGYDLLFIPGGKAPEEVRLDKDAISIVRHFFQEDKYVAAICHGAQVISSAGEIAGRRATCWKGIKDDIISAGGNYLDAEVVVDGNLITSRMPDDLPAFMREVAGIMQELSKVRGERKAA
ncbi:MAG TPA: type 1 glutamine amidotransferase domain-containing protein [Nitrospirota bacterium]|nr:type 1 glutamine amidotransferase domain-containing protein [Nitrospirota bacterium]